MAFREDCNYKWPCTQTGVCSWLDRNCRKWLYWSGIQWRVYCTWKWGIAVFLLLVFSEIRLENAVDEHSSGKNQHDKQTLSFSLFFPSSFHCCLIIAAYLFPFSFQDFIIHLTLLLIGTQLCMGRTFPTSAVLICKLNMIRAFQSK